MKTKKIISIKYLDKKTAQLFTSYCFLLKSKLVDEWFFTNKDLPEIMAISSYKGILPNNTKIVIKIGQHLENLQNISNVSCKIINITIPFNSSQIITELNNISKNHLEQVNIKNKDYFSFKKIMSKLFKIDKKSNPSILNIKSKSMTNNNKTKTLLRLVDPGHNNNLKIVFLGRPGSGKTTAIVSAESEGLVKCEVNATDTVGMHKRQTTIGIDYCQCNFKNGLKLKLFGTPGQGRYSQLQTQTVKNADICIILIDLTSVAPFSEFKYYKRIINSVNNNEALKVALFTHCDQNEHDIIGLSESIKRSSKGDVITAKIDPRNRDEIRSFLELIAKAKLKNKSDIDLQSFSI